MKLPRASEAVAAATDALRAVGVDSPRLDAEVLVAAAAGLDRMELLARPDLGLEPEASRRAMEWIRRRTRREPVAYIVGRKAFRRLELEVDRRVLIPRPDSELLVELAAELAPEAGRVHDAGTGSGAIALALKDERPDLVVTASDRSPGAVQVAEGNAGRLGLDLPVTEAAGVPPGRYDLVVANLPYVRDDEWDQLEPEIREYEPREALVAGADGLDEIRALVAGAPAGTLLLLEHAPDQAEAVRELLSGAETHADLSGRDRATLGTTRNKWGRGPFVARNERAPSPFDACIRGGGVVLFPADTVYGLAVDPANEAAIERMYALKGRPREKRSALMYFSVDDVPDLPEQARLLLPGPVTVILPDGRGIRVPEGPRLAGVPVLQSSANPSGGPDPRRLEDVDPVIRAGVDLEIDGGELPGTPSTVVDLSGPEFRIVREGALPAARVRELLR